MRFFLILWLIMFVGCCGGHGVHASRPVDLSFSVFLEINGAFIYPTGQSLDDPDSKTFEMCVRVIGLTHQSLGKIVLDLCQSKLGIVTIEGIRANIVSFLGGVMVAHVESCTSSSITSPVSPRNLAGAFPHMANLLTLNGGDLIKHIPGQSLHVTIRSPTDSIYTVGYRLRQRELGLLK